MKKCSTGSSKKCPNCSEIVPIEKFYAAGKGYYSSRCKKCILERMKKIRRLENERV